MWNLIDENTPKDRAILVFAPGDDPRYEEPFPDLVCICEWHQDAGFTVDEFRTATHWMEFVRPQIEWPSDK